MLVGKRLGMVIKMWKFIKTLYVVSNTMTRSLGVFIMMLDKESI